MKILAILLLLAALLGGVARYQYRSAPQVNTLTVYCAAGLKRPMEVIAEQYQREEGVDVRLQYGGSGMLLSQLRVTRQGDLYVAADDGSVADARKAEIVQEVFPLARQRPVIAVRKGNPKGIRTIDDLLRADVKVALANPEAASISRVTRGVLGERWEPLAKRATVMKPTVSEIAADVALGSVDAAIIWNSIVEQFKLESVEVEGLSSHVENASACVLSFGAQPKAALRFARFLTAPDKGGAIFKQCGFTSTSGGPWKNK